MIADVGRVVASAAGALENGNATGNQTASGDVVIDACDATDRNLQCVEELFAVGDGAPGAITDVPVASIAVVRPTAIEIENVGREFSIAGGGQTARSFERGQQEVNTRVDADEERLLREWKRPAPGAVIVQIAGEEIEGLRGEQARFEVDDLLLLFWRWMRAIALRVADGCVKCLMRKVGFEGGLVVVVGDFSGAGGGR